MLKSPTINTEIKKMHKKKKRKKLKTKIFIYNLE